MMFDLDSHAEKYLGSGFLSGLLALLRGAEIAETDVIDRCWENLMSEFIPKIGWYASNTSRLNARLDIYHKLRSCLSENQSIKHQEIHEFILNNSGAAEVRTRFSRQDKTTGINCDWVVLSRCIGKDGGVLFTVKNEHGTTLTEEFFD